MEFSIIVSVNNNYELVSNFLENLIRTTDFHYGELVVVSDGCRDILTLNYLREKSTEIDWMRFYDLEKHVGYSKANNFGVNNCFGEILVFLNSDVFPSQGSINMLVDGLAKYPRVGAIQGRLIYPQTGLVQSTGHTFIGYQNAHLFSGCAQDDPLVLSSGYRQALTTAFCAMHRETFFRVGGFDEIYYNAYEGMELTLKVSLSGKKCLYFADAIAFHAVGGSRKVVSFDDVLPGHIFWHRWKDQIHDDLQTYLAPQITQQMRGETYFLMQGSSVPGWETILQMAGIQISEAYDLPSRFSPIIDLYRDLPYAALDTLQPYVFTTNEVSQLRGNKNWSKARSCCKDIVVDVHGVVCPLITLTGADKGGIV